MLIVFNDTVYQSKIVATLVGHALAGQLGRAVDLLSDIRISMTHQNNTTHQTNTPINSSHSMNVVAKIKKLEPQRLGGWSWDGSSNKIAKKNDKQLLNSTTDEAARTNESVSTGNMVVQRVRDCILFHVILWLPYCASDISIEVEYRERFHILIQCAVCSLWRSRIASEDSHEKKATAVKNDEFNNLNPITETDKINNNCNNNNNNNNNNNQPKSKKRKIQSNEKTKMAFKNLVQPTLSLVFLNGSTASITQEQLTISMARKRMAAPTEYQVLSSIIELLNDPILQLIQKIPNISSRNYPDIVEVNDLSFEEKSSGSSGREDLNESGNLMNEGGLWIQSLKSLLPKDLNRKQRKKIHIIDINNLLSSTKKDEKNLIFSGDMNYTGNSRNERDVIDGHNGEELLPSLSSIVYGNHDLPSLLNGYRPDNVLEQIDDNKNNGECNEINNDNDDVEEIPSQVLVLLRPSVHYVSKTTYKQKLNLTAKSPFSSSKSSFLKSVNRSASSLPDKNMEFCTKFDNKQYLEIENMELNKMLNEYMYGKKSKKYDITAQSVLYCKASLFSSIPCAEPSFLSTPSNVLPQVIAGISNKIQHTDTITLNHMNTRNTFEHTKSKYVSPGIAVCVLQHWAYHKRLIPTLQTAQDNYLHSVSK